MKTSAGFSALTAIGFVLCAAIPAQAGWKQGGSPLGPLPGAVVASDGRGGVLGAAEYPEPFTWLYHLTASGDTASDWPASGLELTPGARKVQHTSIAAVAMLPDGDGGSFILTAEQYPYQGSGGFLYPVQFYLHRRSAAGRVAPGWTEDGVRLASPWIEHRFEVHRLPRMVSDGRRGVLVAWLDGVSGQPDPSLHVQRVGADGALRWGVDGTVLRRGANVCTVPAIIGDGTGGALTFWGEWDSTGTSIRVRGQHVLPAGELLWGSTGIAISKQSFDRMASAIPADGGWVWGDYAPALSATPDGRGGAILCWAASLGADLNILAARVAPDGRLPWGRDVVVCSSPGEQASVVSAQRQDAGAVFAWRDGRAGADVGIFAQVVSRAGRTMWAANGVAAGTGIGGRGPVALTSDGHEGVYLAWADPGQGGEVFAQRLTASGRRPLGWSANGVLVSRTARPYVGSVGLQLVEGSRGTAIAVWTDSGEGSLAMLLARHGPAASSLVAIAPSSGPAAGAAVVTTAAAFSLHGVLPNPVTEHGSVSFVLSEATHATLELIDIAGRRVWSREVGDLGPGEHRVSLADGSRLPTGIYFVRLTQGARVATARVTLL